MPNDSCRERVVSGQRVGHARSDYSILQEIVVTDVDNLISFSSHVIQLHSAEGLPGVAITDHSYGLISQQLIVKPGMIGIYEMTRKVCCKR